MNFSKSFILGAAFVSLTTISGATTLPLSHLMTPTPTVINVSGVFQNGAVLSGSFDIMFGQITSADMQISGVKGDFILDRDGGGHFDRTFGAWENVDLSDAGNFLSLDLLLAKGETNLNNYTGGPLCNASNNCGGLSSFYLPVRDRDPILSSGITAAAPEPGATALLGAGLSAFGLTLRRRFIKK